MDLFIFMSTFCACIVVVAVTSILAERSRHRTSSELEIVKTRELTQQLAQLTSVEEPDRICMVRSLLVLHGVDPELVMTLTAPGTTDRSKANS